MENRSKRRSAKNGIPDVTEGTPEPEVEKTLEPGRGEVRSPMLLKATGGCPEGHNNKSTHFGDSRSGATLAVVWSKRGHGTAAREAYAVEGAQQ